MSMAQRKAPIASHQQHILNMMIIRLVIVLTILIILIVMIIRVIINILVILILMNRIASERKIVLPQGGRGCLTLYCSVGASAQKQKTHQSASPGARIIAVLSSEHMVC